ncbi:YceI family protein [Nonomuraea sp. M3C6]|uniref:YceI family protein n=1 Tax=Nonomuraea marmarensis TaxID=3351344 RepID=A0ABW7AGM0_9ACTN
MDVSVGPQTGRLLIKTARTGLGAKAGHDLTIEVTRWHADITLDTADPAACSVAVTVDADSFEVRQGTGGVKALTDADRAEIKQTIREKILHTGSHPTITFRSTRIAGTAESFSVAGELGIAGVTRPVTVHARLVDDRVQGSATIVQSLWGIRPYSAFFGALKLRDEVEVQFDIGGLAAGS